MTSTTLQKIELYKMNVLNELLAQCTEGQQGKFHRLFSPESLKDDGKFNSAIELIERTIKSNQNTKG